MQRCEETFENYCTVTQSVKKGIEVRVKVQRQIESEKETSVTILDRQGLTEASCECYQLVRTRVAFHLPKHTSDIVGVPVIGTVHYGRYALV